MSEKPFIINGMPDIEGMEREKAATLKAHIARKYADKSITFLETRLNYIKGTLQNPPRIDQDTIDLDWEKRILDAETPEELKTLEAKMIVTDIIDAMEEVLKEKKRAEGVY